MIWNSPHSGIVKTGSNHARGSSPTYFAADPANGCGGERSGSCAYTQRRTPQSVPYKELPRLWVNEFSVLRGHAKRARADSTAATPSFARETQTVGTGGGSADPPSEVGRGDVPPGRKSDMAGVDDRERDEPGDEGDFGNLRLEDAIGLFLRFRGCKTEIWSAPRSLAREEDAGRLARDVLGDVEAAQQHDGFFSAVTSDRRVRRRVE